MNGPDQRTSRNAVLHLYIDGASKANPGEAGAGIWITDEKGSRIAELSQYLGRKTNNEAEYWALILGLRAVRQHGGETVRIFTDSELVERQIKGRYRVRNSNLKLLYDTVVKELEGFSTWDIQAIPREENREADRKANQAIRQGIAEKKKKGEGRKETDGRLF